VPSSILAEMISLENDVDKKILRDITMIKLFKKIAAEKLKKNAAIGGAPTWRERVIGILKRPKDYIEAYMNDAEFSEYLRFLKGEVEKIKNKQNIYLEIAGRTVKIENAIPSLTGRMEKYFGFFKDSAGKKPNITITLLQGDISTLVPRNLRGAWVLDVHRENNWTQYPLIYSLLNKILIVSDDKNGQYYIAFKNKSLERLVDLYGEHLLAYMLFRLVSDKDTAVVHAAAVGFDGKGAMIVGRGGK
jgi:hypothetical protein